MFHSEETIKTWINARGLEAYDGDVVSDVVATIHGWNAARKRHITGT